MLEDGEAGLWIRPVGFAPGLARYKDGEFKAYTAADGLPSNRVISWGVANNGSMWFTTDRGLGHYKNGSFTNYSTKDGLPSDTVYAVTPDRQGRTWISTLRGLALFAGGKFTTFRAAEGFPDTLTIRINDTHTGYEDSKGRVWFVTRSRLYVYANGSFTSYTTKDGISSSTVNWIHEDRTGVIWFATQKGLVRFENGRFKSYEASANRNENFVFEIREDHEGSLWLATGQGIKRFANGTFEHYTKSDGLTDNSVQRVFIDKEQSIWVSTFGGGVDRFRDGKFITYSQRTGLSYDNIQPVIEDTKGDLWVGTSDGGVNRIRGGSIRVYDTRNGLPSNTIQTLGEDKHGGVWIGTNRGAVRIVGETLTKFTTKNGLPLDGINASLQLKSGSFLVACFNQVMKYENGSFSYFIPKDSLQGAISWLAEDSKGNVWIGTFQQSYRWEKGILKNISRELNLTGRFESFYEDGEGVIWLGVSNTGLHRYKDGKYDVITPRQGLFDYTAFTILEDQFGYLWMSCNKGVYRVAKQQLNDVADGKSSSVVCTVYGEADGMESRECNGGFFPTGWKRKDGRICFSTVKGVALVNPADIKLNPIPPPVVVERFVVEGSAQATSGRVIVPPGKDRFEFHYAGLSFIGGSKVRYKYKLDGLDKEWVDVGTRRDAYFTNLSPGEYTFKVAAANSDGIWNETGASLSFELRPFFYQTSWFLALGILAFLTTGPSIFYLRTRALKRRSEELESLVNRRTRELQQTLDHLKETQNQLVLSEKMASLGQLTAGIAHEIKNPLNFITNFAVLSQDLTKELREELAHEKKLVDERRAAEIQEILDNLEQNVTKINDHGKRADSIVRGMLLHSRGKPGERQETDLNALLAEYTNLAYHGMRAQDQSFNIKIETDFDPSIGSVSIVPQDLSRAFLNIVNNACYSANDKRKSARDGFSPMVRVSAKNSGDEVEIRIRDNGNGIPQEVRDRIFNPFFTTKPAGAGTGLGLSLTYDIIVQEHKGEIKVDTKEGEFAEFIITIPKHAQTNGGVQR